MTERLKILLLEDNEVDAEIIQRLLKKEKVDFDFRLVMSEPDFKEALQQYQPQVILADNALPRFSAGEALKIVRDLHLHTPFIMVTGSVSEEFAAGMIKQGADDYILKDRLVRLPSAIDQALRQQRARQKAQEAMEAIRNSNERFQTLSRATRDAVWDWNLSTDQVWWNENFYQLIGYDPQLPPPGPHEWTKMIHPEDVGAVMDRLRDVKRNALNSWEAEFRFKMPDGSYGTLLDRAYIQRDAAGQPIRAIGALVDITEQKRLVQEVLNAKIEQQKEINRAILQTQEMERNRLGRELHDNINQILASVSLKLEYYLEEPENNLAIVSSCYTSLLKAIQEARNLSHKMVLPRFSEKRLMDELHRLIENYHYKQFVELELSDMQEQFIDPSIKETLYRVTQEQLSNIYKHAKADQITISIKNNEQLLEMEIADNGVGFDLKQNSKGIGIGNIFNRVEAVNGTVVLETAPGDGCALKLSIPLS